MGKPPAHRTGFLSGNLPPLGGLIDTYIEGGGNKASREGKKGGASHKVLLSTEGKALRPNRAVSVEFELVNRPV